VRLCSDARQKYRLSCAWQSTHSKGLPGSWGPTRSAPAPHLDLRRPRHLTVGGDPIIVYKAGNPNPPHHFPFSAAPLPRLLYLCPWYPLGSHLVGGRPSPPAADVPPLEPPWRLLLLHEIQQLVVALLQARWTSSPARRSDPLLPGPTSSLLTCGATPPPPRDPAGGHRTFDLSCRFPSPSDVGSGRGGALWWRRLPLVAEAPDPDADARSSPRSGAARPPGVKFGEAALLEDAPPSCHA
jgi:hypothetical protein